MRHPGRVAGERFGAAKRHGELGDAQRVEKGKALRLPALQEQRKGAARAKAVAAVDIGLPLVARRAFQKAEIADAFDLGMIAQESADLRRIFAGARHAQLQRLKAPQQHPRGVGVGDGADGVAHQADDIHLPAAANQAARDQIAMPPGIFCEAVDGDVGTVLQRLLPQRAQKGVVDGNWGFVCAVAEDRVAAGGDGFDVDQRVGGVGGAFEIDQRDPAARRLGHYRVDFLARGTGRKIEEMHAEAAKHARDQRFRRGIKRAGMNDRVTRAHQRQEQGGDCGHAARKAERVLGIFPDGEAILQYFLVGPVEARIDQALGTTRTLAGHALEMAFAGGGIGKDEGGGQEDGRLERSFRQHRIIAMPHHQR